MKPSDRIDKLYEIALKIKNDNSTYWQTACRFASIEQYLDEQIAIKESKWPQRLLRRIQMIITQLRKLSINA